MIHVACSNPDCGKSYRVPPNSVGRKIQCKACGCSFVAIEFQPTINRASSETGTDSVVSSALLQSAPALTRIARFELRERLGHGAFGCVYRAFDGQLERDVAIKVPQAGLLTTPELVARFLREAKAAARLTHPYIVPVFDAGRDGDQYYIASAFIDGQPLSEVIDNHQGDFQKIAILVSQLSEALYYAHLRSIIHRDIKPHNVMIDKDGFPHLMDFGLAHIGDDAHKLTHDGAIMGTPAYMSPEQAAGNPLLVDAKSDQFSLAVVFYELLTGRTPFAGSPSIVIFNVINQPPPPPRSINASIPLDLETICMKAMQKSPEGRYENEQLLADDLQRWLRGEPIRARPQGRLERLSRWMKKEPVVALLSFAFVLALIAGTSLSTYFAVIARQKANALAGALIMATTERDRAESEKVRAESEKARADEKALLAERRADELVVERLRLEVEQKRAEQLNELAQERMEIADAAGVEARSAAEREKQAIKQKDESEADFQKRLALVYETAYWSAIKRAFPNWTGTNAKLRREIESETTNSPLHLRRWEFNFFKSGRTQSVSLPHRPYSILSRPAFVGLSNSHVRIVEVPKEVISTTPTKLVVNDVMADPTQIELNSTATIHEMPNIYQDDFPNVQIRQRGEQILVFNKCHAATLDIFGNNLRQLITIRGPIYKPSYKGYRYLNSAFEMASTCAIAEDTLLAAVTMFPNKSGHAQEKRINIYVGNELDLTKPPSPTFSFDCKDRIVPVMAFDATNLVTPCTLSLDGSKLFFSDGKYGYIADTKIRKIVVQGFKHEGWYSGGKKFSKSNQLLITNGRIHRFDWTVGGEAAYHGSIYDLGGLPDGCCAIAPDDSRIFTGHNDGTVRIWRTDREDIPIVISKLDSGIVGIALSEDGCCLSCVTGNGVVTLFTAVP